MDVIKDPEAKYVEIAVTGMTCGACSASITRALESLEGVESAMVSLITERATIYYKNLSVPEIITAIEDTGFDAEVVKAIESVPKKSRIEFKIGGMTCSSCTSAVRNVLEVIDGVETVEVSLASDEAHVTYTHAIDENIINVLREAILDAGFDAELLKSELIGEDDLVKDEKIVKVEVKVFGIPDNATSSLTTIIESLDGVRSVYFNDLTHVLSANCEREVIGIRKIVSAIEQQGFTAIAAGLADNAQQVDALSRIKEVQNYYRNTWKSFILGMPVIIVSKFRNFMPAFIKQKVCRGIWLDDILCLALIIPLLCGPAKGFYVKSYKALKAGTSTMDVLVSISVSSAFTYSLFALSYSIYHDQQNHPMYLWDSCVMILTFVLFGKYLENMARGQTTRALSELISLFPEEALVYADDLPQEGKILPVDMLQYGDVVGLRPGEKVCADGVVISGESFITESIITGESKPIKKRVGDFVCGGTINGLGNLMFKITECGTDTKLSQIVAFVKNAQASRAPIQRYTDAVAARFVPLVILLSAATFVGWASAGYFLGADALPKVFHHGVFITSFRLAISVVVVACPCALGLATPTAVMVGTGAGAKYGILVKGGGVFEMGAFSKVVLFDKTGTLTLGNVVVSKTTVPAAYWPEVRGLESLSEHVIAKAMCSFVHPDETESNVETIPATNIKDFESITGVGIKGEVNGKSIFIGQHATSNQDISVIVNDEVVGTVSIRDSTRPDSSLVVSELQNAGYKVGIVSGDSSSAVLSLCEEIGIDPAMSWSRMKPQDKVDVVQYFQDQGLGVVFVGDGINDSPALATASVGISLEGATHVAVESADVVLTQESPIAAVPAVLDLCRATMRRIRINLFSSIFYNAIMIPFAMGFFLHFHLMLTPMMASAAMALSSISVVVSSLLLKSWSPRRVSFGRSSNHGFFKKIRSLVTRRSQNTEAYELV